MEQGLIDFLRWVLAEYGVIGVIAVGLASVTLAVIWKKLSQTTKDKIVGLLKRVKK